MSAVKTQTEFAALEADGRYVEMKSSLIRDTTREEREEIVADALGNISGTCDGCSAGIVEMYEDYIDGKKELRQINMEFRARYVSGDEGPQRVGCSMGE